jgi:tRNA pseudouridine synthase 10
MDWQILQKIPSCNHQPPHHNNPSNIQGKAIYEGVSLDKVLQALSKTPLKTLQSLTLSPPTTKPTYTLTIHTNSIYIAGRYNKLTRHISNSKWIVNGKRLAQDSIEELIGIHLGVFRNDGYKFCSAGREDADVLMLGSGRPFYMEVLQPRVHDLKQDDMDVLERIVNEAGKDKILVRDLQIVSKSDTSVLKASASTKRKFYKCVISISKPVEKKELERVSMMKEVVLQQRNPTRVPR